MRSDLWFEVKNAPSPGEDAPVSTLARETGGVETRRPLRGRSGVRRVGVTLASSLALTASLVSGALAQSPTPAPLSVPASSPASASASGEPLCSELLGDPAAYEHSLFNEVSFGEDPTATVSGMLGCLGVPVIPAGSPSGPGLRVLYLTIDFQNTGTTCDEGGIHCQATGDGPVTASTLARGRHVPR